MMLFFFFPFFFPLPLSHARPFRNRLIILYPIHPSFPPLRNPMIMRYGANTVLVNLLAQGPHQNENWKKKKEEKNAMKRNNLGKQFASNSWKRRKRKDEDEEAKLSLT